MWGGRLWVGGRPTTGSVTHTHEIKGTKVGTLECKENDQMLRISDVKNVNKRKNRLAPVKLESKKQHKKVLPSQAGSGGNSPSNDEKKPRPINLFNYKYYFMTVL